MEGCPSVPEQQPLGLFANLPQALISVILFGLDPRSLASLACCSGTLTGWCCQEVLWQHHVLTGSLGPVQYQGSWRQTALWMLLQAYKEQQQKLTDQPTLYIAAKSASSHGFCCSEPVATAAAAPKQLQLIIQHLQYAVAVAARPLDHAQHYQSQFLYRRWCRSNMCLTGFMPAVDQVPRVQHSTLARATFCNTYDMPGLPVIVTGTLDAEWPSGWQQHWQWQQLAATYGHCLFRTGLPQGGKAPMQLSTYLQYMQQQADEDPLYIFDEDFAAAAPGMLDWYKVPSWVPHDLMDCMDACSSPPCRWLVAGPARSGASWHVDPSLTSAWNALISGRKRWALYPPHVEPPGLQQLRQRQQAPRTAPGNHPAGASSSSSSSSWCTVTSDNKTDSMVSDTSSSSSSDGGGHDGAPGSGLTSLQWYLEVYPHLLPQQRPLEFVQHPGEVVFIPGGWWHCVLNLEPSIAVTQNFVSAANFERVVAHMARGSKAYFANPLAYYGPQQRQWLALWQQHQRQQSLQQQQQQQQGASVDAAFGAASKDSNSSTRVAEQGQGQQHSQQGSQLQAQGLLAGLSLAGGCSTSPQQQAHVQPLPTPHLKANCSVQQCTSRQGSIRTTQRPSIYSPAVQAVDLYLSSSSSSGDVECCSGSIQQGGPKQHQCQQANVTQQGSERDGLGSSTSSSTGPWDGLLECCLSGKGFRRTRILGPWLQRLWQQHCNGPPRAVRLQKAAAAAVGQLSAAAEGRLADWSGEQGGDATHQHHLQQQQQLEQQQLQHLLLEVGCNWLHVNQWQQLLTAVLAAHGLAAADAAVSGAALFPQCGADSLVFTVGDVVVKLMVGQQGLCADAAAVVEAHMCSVLLVQLQQQQPVRKQIDSQHFAATAAPAGADASLLPDQSQHFAALACQKQQHQQAQEACSAAAVHSQACASTAAAAEPQLLVPRLLGQGSVHIRLPGQQRRSSKQPDTAANATQCPPPHSTSTATAQAGKTEAGGAERYQVPDPTEWCSIPYLILSRVPADGSVTQLRQQVGSAHWQQLARSLGELLAVVHSQPLPGGNSGNGRPSRILGTVVTGAQQMLRSALWQDGRQGCIWSAELGLLQGGAQPADSAQLIPSAVQSNATPAVSAGSAEPPPPPAAAAAAAGDLGMPWPGQPSHHSSSSSNGRLCHTNPSHVSHQHSIDSCADKFTGRGHWWPFLQFLQQHQSAVLEDLQEDQAELSALGTLASQLCREAPAAVDKLAADTAACIHDVQQQPQQQHPAQRTQGVDTSHAVCIHGHHGCHHGGDSSSSSSSGGARQGQVSRGLVDLTASMSAAGWSFGPCTFPLIGVGEDALPCWWVQQLPDFLAGGLSVCCAADMTAFTPGETCDSGGQDAVAAGTGREAGLADVVGLEAAEGTVSGQPCWQPVWLHGDVMSGNVLLELHASSCSDDSADRLAARPLSVAGNEVASSNGGGRHGKGPSVKSVALIDFADAGVGDALHDFVALFASVFDCNVELLQSAMQSYCSSRPEAFRCGCGKGNTSHDLVAGGSIVSGRLPADKAAASVSHASESSEHSSRYGDVHQGGLSRRFLAYLLLHPEGFTDRLLQKHPAVRRMGSLEQVAHHLFGWMGSLTS